MEPFTSISSVGEFIREHQHSPDYFLKSLISNESMVKSFWYSFFFYDVLTMYHLLLKYSFFILPTVKNQRACFQTVHGECFSFCDGTWKAAGVKVNSTCPWPPSIASTSTCLPYLFYRVAIYLRFCFHKILLLKKCLEAIILENWCYCTQNNKSLLFEESFWIVHISEMKYVTPFLSSLSHKYCLDWNSWNFFFLTE